jgi:hypothetical protein
MGKLLGHILALTLKCENNLKVLTRNKHSSLFCHGFSCKQKDFVALATDDLLNLILPAKQTPRAKKLENKTFFSKFLFFKLQISLFYNQLRVKKDCLMPFNIAKRAVVRLG